MPEGRKPEGNGQVWGVVTLPHSQGQGKGKEGDREDRLGGQEVGGRTRCTTERKRGWGNRGRGARGTEGRLGGLGDQGGQKGRGGGGARGPRGPRGRRREKEAAGEMGRKPLEQEHGREGRGEEGGDSWSRGDRLGTEGPSTWPRSIFLSHAPEGRQHPHPRACRQMWEQQERSQLRSRGGSWSGAGGAVREAAPGWGLARRFPSLLPPARAGHAAGAWAACAGLRGCPCPWAQCTEGGTQPRRRAWAASLVPIGSRALAAQPGLSPHPHPTPGANEKGLRLPQTPRLCGPEPTCQGEGQAERRGGHLASLGDNSCRVLQPRSPAPQEVNLPGTAFTTPATQIRPCGVH